MVCLESIQPLDQITFCPQCGNSAHPGHLSEWLKIKGICPICREPIRKPKREIPEVPEVITAPAIVGVESPPEFRDIAFQNLTLRDVPIRTTITSATYQDVPLRQPGTKARRGSSVKSFIDKSL